ncbi:uncharacterized protein [Rutidosis leptorrhynchoides]|uniref:uncharacterized protein isoform X2 n=1 Tax=Rutidosis leptorrhynchoides TaxID=125765 RepID=UPI003A9A5F25
MVTGFHHLQQQQQSSGINQQVISFDSSVRDTKSEMITIGNYDFSRMNHHYHYHNNNSTGGISFQGNSGIVDSTSSTFTEIGNTCNNSLVVDSVSEPKNRVALAVEWSVDEQYKLEEALSKYADEPGIVKYVKTAATLRNKTVRDVALRCRWMKRKRRKHEELNLWKKTKDRKDKVMEVSSKSSVPSNSTINVAPFSVSTMQRVQGDGNHVEVQGSIRHMLDQNSHVLSQISTNIGSLKLQENINLFSQMKNNLNAILNDMRCVPGPPLPVALNEDLANSILSNKTQTMMFTSSRQMSMKQEPGCW